ncbi:MAG: cytochrome c [Gammaproteobacteria bacterium]|nr:MAG: cytochrome c [Gammaproteobacteria bacterium]
MIRRLALPAFLLAALPGSAVAAQATDTGRRLHDQYCFRCHDTSVYTRKHRRVHDRAGLKKQVRRCELSLGLRWFDDEIDSVVDYLDRHYYHFGKGK